MSEAVTVLQKKIEEMAFSAEDKSPTRARGARACQGLAVHGRGAKSRAQGDPAAVERMVKERFCPLVSPSTRRRSKVLWTFS